MPIRPENKARYPKAWPSISLYVRAREGWLCLFCSAKHGEPHPETGSRVVLTVAHLDHQPENCELSNLAALCQKCHNKYDAEHRRKNRIANAVKEREAKGQGKLL